MIIYFGEFPKFSEGHCLTKHGIKYRCISYYYVQKKKREFLQIWAETGMIPRTSANQKPQRETAVVAPGFQASYQERGKGKGKGTLRDLETRSDRVTPTSSTTSLASYSGGSEQGQGEIILNVGQLHEPRISLRGYAKTKVWGREAASGKGERPPPG